MPVRNDAAIEISAFDWVPDFAKGSVRDLRVRWALEEAGLDYREKLFDARQSRPADYLRDQPFGQVPSYDDGEVQIFESGAIVLRIAERSHALMPSEPQGKARAATWVLAALNSVEPPISGLIEADIFHGDEPWAKQRRPGAVENVRRRLGQLSTWLGEREHLEDAFTVGDLMMTSVLRGLRHTDLVAEHDNLARYQARCEARPAFARALAGQLAAFDRRAAAA